MGTLAALLMQSEDLYDTTSSSSSSGGGAGVLVISLIVLAFYALVIIGQWKTFTKAGQPGWAALIPVLNVFVMIKMAKMPMWWILIAVCLWPVFLIVWSINIAKAFALGGGMIALLILLNPIGWLVLGFGKAQYQLEPEPLF